MATPIRVLCVTTDTDLFETVSQCFRDGGREFELETITETNSTFVDQLDAFDCVLVDADGTNLAVDTLAEQVGHAPLVVLTNGATTVEEVQATGATDYFPKQASADGYVLLRKRLEAICGGGHGIQQVREQFRAYVENASDLITVLDEQMQIKYQSPAAEDIIGYEQAELFGDHVLEYVHPADRDRCVAEFEQMITEPGTTTEEVRYRFKHADGSWVWLESIGSNKTTDIVDGYLINSRDITERKRRERELEDNQRELTMLKQVFSRVFRHNIRNELTILQGKLELIDEQTTDDNIHESVATAVQSTNRLLGHVQKAREIERLIEKDPVQTTCALPELVSNAVRPYQHEGGAVTIATDIDPVPVRVIEGFQAAIENAIENAIEHNPMPVRIELRSELDEEMVTLVVADDGDGIPVTEVMVLTEEEETALDHGSGVGLWLMRWYTKKSGGELAIEQTASGTRVQMEMPLDESTH